MPKQVLKLEGFHGGLNSHSDPRDIEPHELSSANSISVSHLGKIKLLGSFINYASESGMTAFTSIKGGTGLAKFASDKNGGEGSDGTNAVEDESQYIALGGLDASNVPDIRIWDQDSNTWSTAGDFGYSTANANFAPVFYTVDGDMRVSDASHVNDTKIHQVVDFALFKDNTGTAQQTYTRWRTSKQELQSFEDLGIDLVLAYQKYSNPNATALSSTRNRLVLSWWGSGQKSDGGFSGRYYLGATPIYKGNQEGPLSIFSLDETNTASSGDISLASEYLYLQAHVSLGTNSAINAGDTNVLGDDRLIGFNIYYKKFNGVNWYKIKEFDLVNGGNHGWGDYNTATDTNTGLITGTTFIQLQGTPFDSEFGPAGTISLNQAPSSGGTYQTYSSVTPTGGTGQGLKISFVYDASGISSLAIVSPGMGYSVADIVTVPYSVIGTLEMDTQMKVNIDTLVEAAAGNRGDLKISLDMGTAGLGTNADGSDRTGAVRVKKGLRNSPLYYNGVNLNSTSSQAIDIPDAVLGNAGVATLEFDVLDEENTVLFSDIDTLDVAESDAATEIDPVEELADWDYGS